MSQTGWTPVQQGDAAGWTPVGGSAPPAYGPQQQAATAAKAGVPVEAARPGAIQTREGGHILNTNDDQLHTGMKAFLHAFGVTDESINNPSLVKGAGGALKDAAVGAAGAVKPIADDPYTSMTMGVPAVGTLETLYKMGSAIGQTVSAHASTMRNMRVNTQTGQSNINPLQTADDLGSGAALGAQVTTGKMVDGMFAPATETAALDGLFDKRYTALDNAQKFGLGKALKTSLARVQAEIGDNVKSITDTDTAANQAAGMQPGEGTLSTMSALRDAKDAMDKYNKLGVALPKIAQAYNILSETAGKTIDFDTMKTIRTQVGDSMRAAFKSDPTSPEYATLRDINKALTDQMQGRAMDLKQQSQWAQYNKLTQQLDTLQKGPVGDMMQADNGYDFMKAFTDQKTGNAKLGAFKALEPYGIDDRFYSLAKESASLVKQLDSEGKWFNWKARLGVGGGLAAIGVPRPFMAAYAAMAGAQAVKDLFSRDAASAVEGLTPGAPQPAEPIVNPPLPKGQPTPFQGPGPAPSQVQAAKVAKAAPPAKGMPSNVTTSGPNPQTVKMTIRKGKP